MVTSHSRGHHQLGVRGAHYLPQQISHAEWQHTPWPAELFARTWHHPSKFFKRGVMLTCTRPYDRSPEAVSNSCAPRQTPSGQQPSLHNTCTGADDALEPCAPSTNLVVLRGGRQVPTLYKTPKDEACIQALIAATLSPLIG